MTPKLFNYHENPIGIMCLHQASHCKGDIGFGAVLVKDGQIIGVGRNRRSRLMDRMLLTHVDYAVHAEQAAIIDAITMNHDPHGGKVYVLGMVLRGSNKGSLTVRDTRIFVCTKCPHTFERFGITVFIPHQYGWMSMTAAEAMTTGKALRGLGYWNSFVKETK